MRDIDLRWKWLNDEQSLVFSQIVEFGNMPQNLVSTIVRFCSFDSGNFGGGNPIFDFQSPYGSQKGSRRFVDGEIGRPLRCYAVARDNRSHHEIKPGSDGINNRANVADNEMIKRFFKIGDKQFPIRTIWRRLTDDLVWITVLPTQETFLEDWDLGLGPLNRD